MSRCAKHQFEIVQSGQYFRAVACVHCGKWPKCRRQKSLEVNGKTITIGDHLHSQGESVKEAMAKARICYALTNGREQVEPVQCRHCGFWTIRDVKGERIAIEATV